jgi:peptidoglycan/xylan/chitin deacetylase (PgdA/CDA1 family)
MRIPGLKTAKILSRWIRARLLGGALILAYHRVSQAEQDYYEVCVRPEYFVEHMEIVRKYAHPISFSELVQHLRNGSVPAKSIVVSFDDGYADTLYQAKPTLEKYAIPATVFVCTGYAGKEFWWDELDRLVRLSRAEVGTLCLDLGQSRFVWNQSDASPEAGLAARNKFRQALYDFLLASDVENQKHAMNMIRSWSGVSSFEMLNARSMSHEELLQLADGGLIELGAHTRHHPMLARLSRERQREEITGSKTDLEGLLGRRVEGFAYPNGIATESAQRIVREASFSHACISEPGLIRDNHSVYQIPRFWPQDWDGEKFTRWLKRWIV